MQGFAVSDRRILKARKIEALLGPLSGLKVLDLGTGSGLIADYFTQAGADVTAADRDDSEYKSDLPFVKIEGTALPFPSETFDVVIYNHVIEHVGDRPQQREALAEIARILKPDARMYLAVPSKWAAIEPHYKLPLLGAMPRPLADKMVRRFRNYPYYDCYPPSAGELLDLLEPCFIAEDRTDDAFKWFARHEMGALGKVASLVPAAIIPTSLYPTMVAVCVRRRCHPTFSIKTSA